MRVRVVKTREFPKSVFSWEPVFPFGLFVWTSQTRICRATRMHALGRNSLRVENTRGTSYETRTPSSNLWGSSLRQTYFNIVSWPRGNKSKSKYPWTPTRTTGDQLTKIIKFFKPAKRYNLIWFLFCLCTYDQTYEYMKFWFAWIDQIVKKLIIYIVNFVSPVNLYNLCSWGSLKNKYFKNDLCSRI